MLISLSGETDMHCMYRMGLRFVLSCNHTLGMMQVASEAAMRAPEEVYKAQQQGAPKSAEELSREERTRLRAKKNRAGKKRKQQEVSFAPLAM